jgi:hypothetical protein
MSQDNTQNHPSRPDVSFLLKSSIPSESRRKLPVMILGAFIAMALIGIVMNEKSKGLQFTTNIFILLLMTVLMVFGFVNSRRGRNELAALESAGELIQLRQWPKAAELLYGLLSSPMRTPQTRLGALSFLIHVLNRFHRNADAIEVYDYLLDQQRLDEYSVYNLRAGRAMAMLKDDRLYDADKAIGQLRQTGPSDSPPLIVLELFHALKTGRSRDLLEMYAGRRDYLKVELGPKSADAHAFAAAAFFQLGDAGRAGECWFLATVIAPPTELVGRFPELGGVSGACLPAAFPRESAS